MRYYHSGWALLSAGSRSNYGTSSLLSNNFIKISVRFVWFIENWRIFKAYRNSSDPVQVFLTNDNTTLTDHRSCGNFTFQAYDGKSSSFNLVCNKETGQTSSGRYVVLQLQGVTKKLGVCEMSVASRKIITVRKTNSPSWVSLFFIFIFYYSFFFFLVGQLW